MIDGPEALRQLDDAELGALAAEIREVLGEGADLFAAAYGVTDDGNWEGVTILSRVAHDDELATVFDLPVTEVASRLADARARLMTDGSGVRHDPLLPNAGIVARREYRDRVRSPFFLASTVLLMALALGVGLAPIAIRYMDRHTVTRIVVVADDQELGIRAIAVTDSLLNTPPGAVDAAAWEKAG